MDRFAKQADICSYSRCFWYNWCGFIWNRQAGGYIVVDRRDFNWRKCSYYQQMVKGWNRNRRWFGIMCNGTLPWFFQKFKSVFFSIAPGCSLERGKSVVKKGGEEDAAAVPAFYGSGILRNAFMLRGSYTVETAFIFPIVLFVILFLIYLAFYLHNCVVIKEAAYETAIYGTTLDFSDPKEMKQKMLEKYDRAIEGRLISMEKAAISITIEQRDITVCVKSRMKTAGLGFLSDFNQLIIFSEKTVTGENPLEKILLVKLLNQKQ